METTIRPDTPGQFIASRGVPDDWRPYFDGRGNFSVPGARCAGNVGRGVSGHWNLMDPWGTVWAFGFATRIEAARFAYALVLGRAAVGTGAA